MEQVKTPIKYNPTVEDIIQVLQLEEYQPVWERPEQIGSGKVIPMPDVSTFNLEQTLGFQKYVEFINGTLTRTNPADGKELPVDLLVLMGVAGTGKSYLNTKTVQFLLHRNPDLKIGILTPTHQAGTAAKKMSSLAGAGQVKFATIHSVAGVRKINNQETGKEEFKPIKEAKFEDFDILLIDEAGMVPEALYYIVRTYCKVVKIILTGDPAQLGPVGELMSKAYDTSLDFWQDEQTGLGTVVTERIELTKPMRAALDHPITSLATLIRKRTVNIKQARGMLTQEGFRLLRPGVRQREFGEDDQLDELLLEIFESDRYRNDPYYCTLLAWSNKAVGEWNRRIRMLINTVRTGRPTRNVPVLFEREYIKLQAAYVVQKESEGFDETGYFEESEDLGEQIYMNNEVLRVIDYTESTLTIPGVNIDVPLLMCTVEKEVYGHGWVERSDVPVVLSGALAIYKGAMNKLWNYVQNEDQSLRQTYWDLRNYGPVLARYPYASTVHKRQGVTDWLNIVDAKNIGACKYFPKTRPEEQRIDEFWRLLYTGGTRAKRGIIYLY